MESAIYSVDKNLKEKRLHGDYAFPVEIRTDHYASNSSMKISCFPYHWHPEIEIMLVLSGCVKYQVNALEYTLKSGEGLFINSNQLHTIYCLSEEAVCLSAIFHPRFLYGYENSREYEKYIDPVISSSSFSSHRITMEHDSVCRTMPALMERCRSLVEQKKPAWELHLKGCLLSCWGCLYTAFLENQKSGAHTARKINTAGKAKSIMQFIQENYTDKISLAEISAAAALSPGECGRICKKFLHQTPFEYLNAYRIEQSIPDLLKKDLSITEIALKNGFSSSSYYAETFKTIKGMSPTAYRQTLKETEEILKGPQV